MIPPIDTSTLGPIKVDPGVDKRRADGVREALNTIANDLVDAGHLLAGRACSAFCILADDDSLAKLGRLLR